ncbi:MAG: PIG-L family deacetylase [Verrucomicrobiales bacterium]|nr:PIG-L family deacetylase [Verrucomicrobiales bacterium]MED5585511.1 PIG-L family deacetylase [Verrucomicrobiota bacterium]
MAKSVIAIVAHPDDIEFLFAGTMLELSAAGYQLHYMALASGNCGSLHHDAEETRRVRSREAEQAAGILGAVYHPPLCDDLEIVYSVKMLRCIASVIRAAAPQIVLTHSPDDYMVDHMETARLAVTAAFTHGMPNFVTEPAGRALSGHQLAVYHAMPHGLKDGLRGPVNPESYVDTSAVMDTKRSALAAHKSQQEWLGESQGMSSFLSSMEQMSMELGRMSGCFEHAEGWRRRLHYGFSCKDYDPMADALGEKLVNNPDYQSDRTT